MVSAERRAADWRSWLRPDEAPPPGTLGAGMRYTGLMGGRLVILGDLTYAYSRTPINVSGGTYYNNGVPNSPTGNVFIGATSFSDTTTDPASCDRSGHIVSRTDFPPAPSTKDAVQFSK